MTDLMTAIDAALDANDIPAAAAFAEKALAAGNTDPIVFNLAAWQLEQANKFEEAEALLQRALTLYPSDASLHLALGVALRSKGSLKDAVDQFERAISLDPGYGAAWFERGATFEKGGAIADAIDDYQRAVELEPDNAFAHAALSAARSRRGEMNLAKQHAETAMKLAPDAGPVRKALAQIALEEKNFDRAIALLNPIADPNEDRGDLLVSARSLLGDAYHGAGQYALAYQAYQESQDQFRRVNEARITDEKEDAFAFLDRIATSMRAADRKLWPQPVPGTGAGLASEHVVLTGYPRSGTTLVENILATLPDSVATEERPTLRDTERRFLSRDGGLEEMLMLPESELDLLRDSYWDRAARAAGEDLSGKIFIDMDPFKGPRLPVIARLFPNAKVIIMRRDPRDVVWSCFHTSFAFNAGTMAFTSLESTARHYAATWSIIEDALSTLPITSFELRYDQLVREFDATTRAVCAFLNVPWNEGLRKFDRTAERRGVSTASATQVRKGLYDGSGGWRNYAERLKTVEPILAPWVERFGFSKE